MRVAVGTVIYFTHLIGVDIDGNFHLSSNLKFVLM